MEEKKNIGQLFDNIAGTYDKFNHVLSLNIDKSWRKAAVKSIPHSEKLLDVAIGTGDLALEIIRQKKARRIIGIDLSDGMMELGQKKVDAAGLTEVVTFQKASALDMPFENESFDCLTCAYGVRNFSDLEKGLSEMYRVLKKGGNLMILEFSYPANPFVRKTYDFFFCNIMPGVGKLISKNTSAYTYFKNSVKNFIWGQQMADTIAKAGFKNVKFKTLTFGISTIYLASK